MCVAAKQTAQTVSRWRYGDMEHFCVKSTGVKQFHKKITKFLWLLNLVLTKLSHVPTNLQSLLPQLFPPNKTIKMFFNCYFCLFIVTLLVLVHLQSLVSNSKRTKADITHHPPPHNFSKLLGFYQKKNCEISYFKLVNML